MNRKSFISSIVAALVITGSSLVQAQDYGERANDYLDHKGDRIENRLRIATTTTVRVGTPVSLVTIRSGKITLSPAAVTEFQTRDGNVHAFSIGTEFDEDGVAIGTEKFYQGTFVLDSAGDLLGMADNSGAFLTAQRIAETVARFQADPTFPEPVCS